MSAPCDHVPSDAAGEGSNKPKTLRSLFERFLFYVSTNLPFLLFIAAFVVIQIGLIFIQLHEYRHYNVAVKVARVCGILLDFASALIILLVMRRLVTWLRNSLMGHLLPIDSFISFHKALGFYLVILTVVHTIGHGTELCMFSAAEVESTND